MKWEYHAVTVIHHKLPIKDTNEILNHWGDEGWELVTIVPDADQEGWAVAVFKRPANSN